MTDRAIADENMSIRLSKPERQALKELCALRAAEIEGTGAVITEAGLLRALLVREAKAVLGGLPKQEPKPEPILMNDEQIKAAMARALKTSRSVPPLVEDDPRQLPIPTLTPTPSDEIPAITSTPEPTAPKKNGRAMTEQAVRARLKKALDSKATTATDFATATGTYAALVARWASGKDAFGEKLETVHAALEAIRR